MDQQILFNKSKINEDVLDELIGLPADIILERVGGNLNQNHQKNGYIIRIKMAFGKCFGQRFICFFTEVL